MPREREEVPQEIRPEVVERLVDEYVLACEELEREEDRQESRSAFSDKAFNPVIRHHLRAGTATEDELFEARSRVESTLPPRKRPGEDDSSSGRGARILQYGVGGGRWVTHGSRGEK